MQAQGILRPDRYFVGCYPKFDLVARLDARRERLFANDRPTVLYNPHFEAGLSSWPRDGFKVLDFFAGQQHWNLIFAPHIRLFDRHQPDVLAKLARYRAHDHLLIDPGSDASIDMTYTQAADLYLGDVSSQVAEFMVRPRPCVFINSHGARWQGNPDYLFWELGPVIDSVEGLDAVLADAVAGHGQWLARQRAYFRDTFDADPDAIGASAADGAAAVAAFLERTD